MSRATDYDNQNDLAFFGRVNASISHELKNILAIISEAAGLLNDLTELASAGTEANLEMLRNCSRDIGEEIQRGFATIKQMNSFSHSVDDPLKKIDLMDTLRMMSTIAGLLSYASRVRIDHSEGERPEIFTAPFRFQHLVYELLVFAFRSAGSENEIEIRVRPGEDEGARIIFSGLKPSDPVQFPSELTRRLAETLGAEMVAGPNCETIEIRMPQSIPSAT